MFWSNEEVPAEELTQALLDRLEARDKKINELFEQRRELLQVIEDAKNVLQCIPVLSRKEAFAAVSDVVADLQSAFEEHEYE